MALCLSQLNLEHYICSHADHLYGRYLFFPFSAFGVGDHILHLAALGPNKNSIL